MERKTIVSLLNKSPFRTVVSLVSYFQNKKPKNYFYKPIGIEVEITNSCNLRCRGCNIIIDELSKPKDILTDDNFLSILKDCQKSGFLGYSITGGEPFLKFNTVLKIISFDHDLDLYKLNTNASFFKTITLTREYLGQLKKAGLGRKNKYMKPVIVVSLGHQNLAGVPIQNSVNLISQIYNFFDPEEVSCSLNLTDANMILVRKIYQDFKRLFTKSVGKNFDEKLFQVRFFSLTTIQTLSRLNLISGPKVSLEERIEDFKKEYLSGGCFNIGIKNTNEEDKAETLIPRCVLRPNGDVYACFGFNRVHKIGNVLEESIREIIRKANRNIILKTVFTKNLKGLYHLAFKNNGSVKKMRVEKQYGPCDICQILAENLR